MVTAIIWNEIEQLNYAISDKDLRKYHGIYVGAVEPDDFEPSGSYDDMAKELSIEAENFKFVTIAEFADAIKQGAFVIECGSVP
jgi:hypothetical protein